MDVTIKMSDATRWRPTKAGLELLGERLGPVYRDLDLGGGAPLPPAGRGLYYELTRLVDPLPEIVGATPLPAGLTRGTAGLEIVEPDSVGFGSAQLLHFSGCDPLDDYLQGGEHGRIEVVAGWAGSLVTEQVNGVLVGLVNPTTQEFAACGLLGTGTTGSSSGVGAVVKLGLDPRRISVHNRLTRRVTLRWAPILDNVSADSQALLEVVYSDVASPGLGSYRRLDVLDPALSADWIAFIRHADTQPGIVVTQDSMGPTGDADLGVIESLYICP